jgi:adenylate kinase
MASILVLMGPQGAGKGTQAQMLNAGFGLPIVATGDMLRDIAASETPLGRQVREVQAAGRLVSDDILADVVSVRLSSPDCAEACILDGFPRTLPQARLLEKIAEAQGHEILVVEIDVPRELLYKRLTGRKTCSVCGAIYHVYFKPSKQDGVCDLDGSPLFTRSDDNEESIARRLALYDEKTQPLFDYYAQTGRLHKIDGTGSPEEVGDRVARIVRDSGTVGMAGKRMGGRGVDQD